MSALVVLFAVVIAAFVAITVAFVGAIMEFVFVESLREREVHVHEYANAYWRRGLRLFGFRLVLASSRSLRSHAATRWLSFAPLTRTRLRPPESRCLSIWNGVKMGRREFESRLRPPEGRRIPSYPTGPCW